MNWEYMSAANLSWRKAGRSSCIGADEMLQTSQGPLPAKGIYEALLRGHRVSFPTLSIEGEPGGSNPLIGAIKTRAEGVRIFFEGGRSAVLTIGHVLPVSEPWTETGWLPVEQQEVIRAGLVRPGAELLDGPIQFVQRLGLIDAVRLWTSYPAWIKTASGLSIGTRWHEIFPAWIRLEEEGDPEYPEQVPVAGTGWLYVDSEGELTGHQWHHYKAVDGQSFSTHGLGDAALIRATLEQQPTAGQSPVMGLPWKLRKKAWKKPGMSLTEALIGGAEVIGDPVSLAA